MVYNMWIVFLGAALTGLMWGWLVATRIGGSTRPVRNTLVLLGATLLLGTAIALKVEYLAIFPFLISAFLAFCVHLEWRHQVGLHFNS
jgi:hypothetical protein